MYILGLHTSHDTSACLLRDGRIVAAIEKERLSRHKHQWGNGELDSVVDYCLEVAGITLDDVEHIVVNDINNIFRETVFREREHLIGHHLAHAWAAVGLSPFDECAVLVLDGEGSKVVELTAEERAVCRPDIDFFAEKESCYHYSGNTLTPVRKWTSGRGGDSKFSGTDATGSPYWLLSQLFFDREHQESKIMGLAAYGRPTGDLSRIFELLPGGRVRIDTRWIFGLADFPRNDVDGHFERYAHLATEIQAGTESAIVHKARWLRKKTGSPDLCFSGGVALNCVANTRLNNERVFRRTFVPFGAGDSSIAIGCAYFGWHVLAGMPKRAPGGCSSPYLGRAYPAADVEACVARFVDAGLVEAVRRDDAASAAARSLADGEVVAWFQGRSEFGPRALGNRSILADPSVADARERLNARVKYRESFRPLAPSVVEEKAGEWFENIVDGTYFMQFVADVRADRAARIPAVTHVDGTARLQLVSRELNPAFHDLLTEFERISGIPILLNTSFNIQEPIVESPDDALLTFAASSIDSLFIHDHHVRSLVKKVRDPDTDRDAPWYLVVHKPVELRRSAHRGRRLQVLSGMEQNFRFGNHYTVSNYPEAELSEALFHVASGLPLAAGSVHPLTASEKASICSVYPEFESRLVSPRICSLLRRA